MAGSEKQTRQKRREGTAGLVVESRGNHFMNQPTSLPTLASITGCILGTAVGDSIGLPAEGLSRQRQLRLYPSLDRQHFCCGIGMISDDTEHTCMVAQALIASAGEPNRFTANLAWQLRFWLLGLPAGIGFATLRACLKLCLGMPAKYSGVFSAGNGPAMRSAVLGVCFGHDVAQLRSLVKANTRITHTDPKAEYGALAIAVAAFMSSRNGKQPIAPDEYWQTLQKSLADDGQELLDRLTQVVVSVKRQESTENFVKQLGCERGISGYMYHTVPAVIHAWLSHPLDYQTAVTEIIRCGGDTDTTAAILGGIVGAGVGETGIPSSWLNQIYDWPRSVSWMRRLARQLADVCATGKAQTIHGPFLLWIWLRNFEFTLLVLAHGLRRLVP